MTPQVGTGAAGDPARRSKNGAQRQPAHQDTPDAVLIIQKRLAPFRLDFFDELGAISAEQIVVVYGSQGSAAPPPAPAFEPREVRTLRWLGGRLLYQPDVPHLIRTERFGAIVAEARLGLLSNLLAFLAARRAGIAFIWWTSAFEPSSAPIWRKPIPKWRPKILSAADGIIAYGSAPKRALVDAGLDPAKVWIAPNTIDVESWSLLVSNDRRLHARHQHGVGEHDVVILFVGKMRPEKRIELLLKAYGALEDRNPRVLCWLVGDGIERNRLEYSTDGQRAGVRFFGAEWNREILGDFYNAADVFVLPGTGGLALNQAMAFGLPVVVSEADGTEEDLVQEGVTGLYFRSEDVTSLVSVLERLVASADRRQRIGQSAMRHVLENLSLSRTAEAFSNAVSEIRRSATRRAWIKTRQRAPQICVSMEANLCEYGSVVEAVIDDATAKSPSLSGSRRSPRP